MYILLLKNKNSVFYLKNFKDQFTRGDLVKLKHSSYDKDQELERKQMMKKFIKVGNFCPPVLKH